MTLDFDVISRSLPYLWKGFVYTVELTAIASVGGLFFGRFWRSRGCRRRRCFRMSRPVT